MEPLLRDHAYTLIFLLGFAEYVGVPVAATPLMLTVGAMTATGNISLAGALAAVVTGGLLGDLVWFSLLRWRGQRVVQFACGLSANPSVCAVRTSVAISKGGTARLMVAKFIPGLGAVTAAASGLAGVTVTRFVLVDTLALTLWAVVYLVTGRLFSGELALALMWARAHPAVIATVVAALVGAAVLLRARKMWHHRGAHRKAATALSRAA